MSDVLLDFVDRLVDRDDVVTSGDESFETSAFLSAANETEAPVEEYCYIPTEIFEDFAAEPFQNTNIIEWMHSVPPRFGKTTDVLNLILGTESQQQEYVMGLLASGLSILFFFLLWGALLLFFRCVAPANGSNSTRWLGGQPLRMPSPPLGSKNHYTAARGDSIEFQEWKRDYHAAKFQLNCFRIIVWFAGLSVSIAALVMSVYGVDSLTNTLEAGRESLGIVRQLAGDAQSIVDSVIRQNENLSSQVFGLLEDVNGMCPLVKDPLCDNVYDFATCDVSAFLGDDLNNVLQSAGNHFVEGEESGYYKEIVNAKNGLEDVQILSQDIDSSAAQLNWALTMSMIFSLLLAMLCLLILCGLICPNMPKVLQCLQSKLMIPTFAILVFFAYLFSMVFVTASVATADICVYQNTTNNVDARILLVLTQSQTVEDLLGGQETQTLVGDFIGFYINRCPVELLPQEILEQLEYVKVGAPVLREFSTIVEQSTGLIQGVCGFAEDDAQQLVSVADTLQVQLCSVADIVTDVRDFIQCTNWYPLYETTVYEALCYDGTEGFAYVATTQFVIVLMSFVILTFRVAFWDVQVGDEYYDFIDDEDGDENYSGGSEGSDIQENSDNGGPGGYYSGIREKLAATSRIRPTSMEGEMEELRDRQWQEVQERHRASAALPPASPALDLRSKPSLEDSPGVLTAATNSLSSSFEHQDDPLTPPPQKSESSRTSWYSSLFWSPLGSKGDLNVGGTFDGEDGGIEIEQVYSPTHFDRRTSNDEANSPNTARQSHNETTNSPRRHPSRFVDATSLWVRQHQNNIDYVDDSDENYSNGSPNENWE